MNKKYVTSIFIMLVLTFAFILFLPKNQSEKKTLQIFDVFDTYSEITVISKTPDKALFECNKYLHEADNLWSFTDRKSEISALNSANDFISLSPDTLDILKKSVEASLYTDGFFDVAIGRMTELWDFKSSAPKIPEKKDLADALEHSGWKNLIIENDKAFLKNGAKVNLGGIAKGYACNKLKDILTENNVTSALINLGGNVYAMGKSPWPVSIKDPVGDDILCTLLLSDTAVVTSGNYERFFELDGVRYHHILNPYTAECAKSGLSSVTIISPDSAKADVLSTACFVLGFEKSLPLLSGQEVLAIFVTDKNEVFYSAELEGFLEYQNPSYQYTEF